ncbi:SDR family oxidoreductase [bacterium]|nr:SDR family oxidoreductase [bacterium]
MPKAIITGASAGIGDALARRLARAGYDLLLVARREERLKELAATLSREHKVQVDVLGLDVTASDAAARLLERAGDADVLVNNAGYGKHGPSHEVALEASTGMVRLNCEALTGLMMAFLPRMIARKSGTILNIASIAGFQPIPWFAVYSATKAYVLSLSIAVDAEVKRHGVRVLSLCPGPVPTEFQAIAETDADHARWFPRVSAEQCAEDAYWMIRRGRRVWIPNWFVRTCIRLEALVPMSIIVYFAGRTVPPPAKKHAANKQETPA